MSEWKAKRFWTETRIAPCEGGWQILLDDRVLRSPAKAALTLPTQSLADAIREEWAAQEGEIDPNAMPLTRAVNSTVDKVMPQQHAVAQMLAAYGGTDLICYRAETPEALIQRQAALWDPLLDWAARHFGARLVCAQGVMPVVQDADAVGALAAPLYAADPFRLTALHDLITLPGSLVIGLAVSEGHLTPQQAWHAARVDADWQEQHWGQDDEATVFDQSRKAQFNSAAQLLSLLHD